MDTDNNSFIWLSYLVFDMIFVWRNLHWNRVKRIDFKLKFSLEQNRLDK